MKKYGITNNPARRKQELKNEHSGFSGFKVEKKFPSKAAAQKWENTKPNAHPGGPKTFGPVYGYSYNAPGKKR